MSFDVWITSNSPGEVSSWVGGLVPELHRLRPEWRIRVALVPCPYASGAEKRVAEAIPGVSQVLSPWETSMWALGLKRLPDPPAPRGLVMFLGGDPWHALWLRRKLGYPAFGYFEKRTAWARRFDGAAFAYASDLEPARLSECAVGNLMVDRVGWNPGRSAERPWRIGIFPGSRPWQVRITLGPMLSALDSLARQAQQPVEFVLVQSPFVGQEELEDALQRPFKLGLPNAEARVEPEALVLPSGLSVARRRGGLETLDLALTIPGTNTAELACAGVPFVVALHPLAFIGGGGLSGVLERLPLPAPWKAHLRQRKRRRLGYTALPNQKAGREVMPEIVLDRSVEPLVAQFLSWMESPGAVEQLRLQLTGILGQPGATARLAQWILHAVGG